MNRTNLLKWLIPTAAFLLLCGITFVAVTGSAGLFFWNRVQIANQAPAPDAAQIAPVGESETAQTVPNIPNVVKAESARLGSLHGWVAVTDNTGNWVQVTEGWVSAGQSLRTGPLSSVHLRFFDGSRVYVGPNTEIALERSGLQKDGARVVVIQQLSGETTHNVVPADQPGSTYYVRTPSGNGQVKGTSFDVVVKENASSQFVVFDGNVAVTNQNVTVDAQAGQMVAVEEDEPPADPVFTVTGEGEVISIEPGVEAGEEIWTIAGMTFIVSDLTEKIGDPGEGDWVFVQGHLSEDGTQRIADVIVLIRSDLEGNFSLFGVVDSITEVVDGDDEWMIAGQLILVNEDTEVDPDIVEGDMVYAKGIILEGGSLLATSIHLAEPEGQPFEFVGTVIVNGGVPGIWNISDQMITAVEDTEVIGEIAGGDLVRVEGVIVEGEWIASEIKLLEDESEEDAVLFEFTGIVESTNPFTVSGIVLTLRDGVDISDISDGDIVKVKGVIQDGVWMAYEITLVDPGVNTLVFVGILNSMPSDEEPEKPWSVSGIDLTLTDDTVVEEGLKEGDLVRVEMVYTEEDGWLTTRIERVTWETGIGCMEYSDLVVSVDDTSFTLQSGLTLSFDDEMVSIFGDLQVYSVVMLNVCYDDDGVVETVLVTVLFQINPPLVEATPTPTPEGEEEDDSTGPGEVRVTICHKPDKKGGHTITIAEPALQAHLAHGDIEGPCP